MTSLPALAIDPSVSIPAPIAVWLERADPRITALISEALGSDASIVEVDVGQIPRLLASVCGPSVLVCDTRRADLGRALEAVSRHSAPVPVITTE